MSGVFKPLESFGGKSWDELFGSRYVIYAMSELGGIGRRVTEQDLKDWVNGLKRPNFLTDFEGWWLAVSTQYRLITTKYYVIDLDQITNWIFEDCMKLQLPTWMQPKDPYPWFKHEHGVGVKWCST